jgi:hypothetical protein
VKQKNLRGDSTSNHPASRGEGRGDKSWQQEAEGQAPPRQIEYETSRLKLDRGGATVLAIQKLIQRLSKTLKRANSWSNNVWKIVTEDDNRRGDDNILR